MRQKRKRPTYTFTLDPLPMGDIEEFAQDNGLSLSFCMREAVRNYARSVRQKKRSAYAEAQLPSHQTRAFLPELIPPSSHTVMPHIIRKHPVAS